MALNAAGKIGTAASFYLPLDRIKRAVDLLKEGKQITRGTLQATFEVKPAHHGLGFDRRRPTATAAAAPAVTAATAAATIHPVQALQRAR